MPVCSWCPLWVSILIQPEGWMLLIFGDDGDDGEVFQSSSSPKAGCYCYGMSGAGNPDKFQSSSSPKAGCYIPHQQIKKWGDGFNPHPARRLDATVYTVKTGRPKTVSILIQPEGWMLLCSLFHSNTFLTVSILIQPEGWMLHPGYLITRASNGFQSSSSPKAGCYFCTYDVKCIRYQFQSSSSPKAGCYLGKMQMK